ncbi:MAG: hypothetical protein GX640_01400 [Fibrobacter sp.]|nr:hypothetical protein [Fibrobacter sp.]
MKRIGYIIGVIVLLVGSAVISENTISEKTANVDSVSEVQAPKDTLQRFTAADLVKYDGKEGRKAYVAIGDSVYDLTNVWKSGMHQGLKAGADHTEKIKKAPHGEAVLKKLTVVGVYVRE